jgi:hypothetical protein
LDPVAAVRAFHEAFDLARPEQVTVPNLELSKAVGLNNDGTDSARTLQVFFYAGPGTGKSTTAALVFGALKQAGRNVEIAHEYAKELTWEQAHGRLEFQPLVVAEQMWRLERVEGQVEAVICDTSPLYGLIYSNPTRAFREWIVDDYRRRNALNIYLHRDPKRGYNVRGRNQTAVEATRIDTRIMRMLTDLKLPFLQVGMDKSTDAHIASIVAAIERELDAPVA